MFPWWVSGKKLRELLKQHGNMKNVDIYIKKWQTKMHGEGNRGKWVTRKQLLEIHGYTQPPSCMNGKKYSVTLSSKLLTSILSHHATKINGGQEL